MSRNLTFLIAHLEAVGHFNACIGIGQQLLLLGHKVVFATPNSFKGKLEPLCFTEEYFHARSEDEISAGKWGDLEAVMAPALDLPSIQKRDSLSFVVMVEMIQKVKNSARKLGELLDRVKPDSS